MTTFQASKITDVTRDPVFPTYTDMVVLLDQEPEALGSWGEGSLCHQVDLMAIPRSSRSHKRQRFYTGSLRDCFAQSDTAQDCPFKGKRSWEMALGRAHTIVKTLAERGIGLSMANVVH